MAAVYKRNRENVGTLYLHNGDSMTQTEFHRAYEAMPESYRAELLGGVVYEPSPLGYDHGTSDSRLLCLLEHYAAQTPGVRCASGATVILGKKDEVQPDALLRIQPEYGGQSGNTKKKRNNVYYVQGAPELLAEVAHTNRAIDLHIKKDRYTLSGVLEYIVLCLKPLRFYWFDLRNNQDLTPDASGMFCSAAFPGLWIDGEALLTLDYDASMKALNAGMQTSKYKQFAARLAQQKE